MLFLAVLRLLPRAKVSLRLSLSSVSMLRDQADDVRQYERSERLSHQR